MKYLLLSFLVCLGSSCKTTDSSQVRNSLNQPLISLLLLEDSKSSRESLAAKVEEHVNNLVALENKVTKDSIDKLKFLRVNMQYTASALRGSAHSLCDKDDLITLYRGTSKPTLTKSGRPIVISSGLNVASDLGQAFKDYAATWKDKEGQVHNAIDENDFFAMTIRHSMERNPSRSLFVSISSSIDTAISFSNGFILTLKMCPQRAFATAAQAEFESEFLPSLAILPEEIASVSPITGNETPKSHPSVMESCLATESKILIAYNKLLVKLHEGGGSLSFSKFLKEECKVVR